MISFNNNNLKMADILARSTNSITNNNLRQSLHYHSKDTDEFSESLQVINPELTIHDLLNSMDSQPSKNNQPYPISTLPSTAPNQQYNRAFSKQVAKRQHARQSYEQCTRNQLYRQMNINNIKTMDYHIRRAVGVQEVDVQQQDVFEMVVENQQMQGMIENLLNQLHEETQISEQLMQKTMTNNRVLAQYKSMHYYYEQQIANIVPLLQQYSPPKVHNRTSHHNINNSNKQNNSSMLNMLHDANSNNVKHTITMCNKLNNHSMSAKMNDINKRESMNMSVSINTNSYTLQYPTIKYNSNQEPDTSIASFHQLLSELQEQSNATDHKHKDIDHAGRLFRNSIPLSMHQHQNQATPKYTLYKKVVPNTTWNPEIPQSSKNYIQENKANLRRRLCEKQPNQLPDPKKPKLQSKLSTPVKNDPNLMDLGSGSKFQQNKSRKAIFTQSIKTSQQNSGRGRVSAVKIDVRALK